MTVHASRQQHRHQISGCCHVQHQQHVAAASMFSLQSATPASPTGLPDVVLLLLLL
jgi:hypothetical protein